MMAMPIAKATDEDVVADRPHPRRPVAEVVAAGDPLRVEAEEDEEQRQPEADRESQGIDEAHDVASSFMRSTARKASCGISTEPIRFIRCFPSFCFSSSLRLRVTSPP